MKSLEKNNKEKSKLKTKGTGVILATLALAGCMNTAVSVENTQSKVIMPCARDLAKPNASDNQIMPSNFSLVLDRTKLAAKEIYDRVTQNGGKILLDPTIDDSATVSNGQLKLNYDLNSSVQSGFSVSFDVVKGVPQIGIGALACNFGSKIYETSLEGIIQAYSSNTKEFPS